MTFSIFLLCEDDSNPMRVGHTDDPETASKIFLEECRATKNIVEQNGIATLVYLTRGSETVLEKRFVRVSVGRIA
jgi:hypothetical protein